MDAVLPAPKAEVEAAAEQVGLEAGLAVERDDPALGDRPLGRPEFFDDAHAVVRNVARRPATSKKRKNSATTPTKMPRIIQLVGIKPPDESVGGPWAIVKAVKANEDTNIVRLPK